MNSAANLAVGFDPGSVDRFFLIVADDEKVDGSYGQNRIDGVAGQRPPHTLSDECFLPQELADACDG